VRNAIAENDPAVLRSTFTAACVCDVNRLVVTKPTLAKDQHCKRARIITEDPARSPRRILGMPESEEEDRADRDPQDVDPEKHLRPASDRRRDSHIITAAMNQGEIEQKLIEIVRQEKPDFAPDKLTPETPLADAGIDSLDALTILFAIEETFKISVPDDRARAMKTFGDMVNAVVALLPAS
jgi:acyl carrier protein